MVCPPAAPAQVYSGRIHNTLTGRACYPIGLSTLQLSEVLERVNSRFGTYLLPQVFPEGSPLHPSYGAGHATVAGACVTIAKAFFDETFCFPPRSCPLPTAQGWCLTPGRMQPR